MLATQSEDRRGRDLRQSCPLRSLYTALGHAAPALLLAQFFADWSQSALIGQQFLGLQVIIRVRKLD